MSRSIIMMALALAVGGFGMPGSAWAQFANPGLNKYSRPITNPYAPLSPYLNMFRQGPAAVNYYGLVRPQIQTSQSLQQLQQNLLLQQNVMTPTAGGVDFTQQPLVTGHPVQFFNYSHYFPMMGRFSGGAGGSATRPLALPNTGPGGAALPNYRPLTGGF